MWIYWSQVIILTNSDKFAKFYRIIRHIGRIDKNYILLAKKKQTLTRATLRWRLLCASARASIISMNAVYTIHTNNNLLQTQSQVMHTNILNIAIPIFLYIHYHQIPLNIAKNHFIFFKIWKMLYINTLNCYKFEFKKWT